MCSTVPDNTRDDARDKRQAILSAARELFATRGYDETTIAEIARVAGVAVGTVYLYFQSKHDILLDVCLALNEEVAQAIRSPANLELPIRQVPRAIIEATFRISRANLHFMGYYQIEAQSPTELRRMRDSKRQIADSIDAFFQLAISQGRLPPFDSGVYAALLNELVSASLQQCFAIERGEREAFYREGVIAFIERLFFGPPLASGGSSRTESPTDTE
jgi:AcrR family transcriptional regulator